MIIRKETNADIDVITHVTIAAFKTLPISNHTEQYIINALRAAEVLTISLVAEIDGQIVGHIAFSPVTISSGAKDWYGLGPISVLPGYQKQGIGKTKANYAITRMVSLRGYVRLCRAFGGGATECLQLSSYGTACSACGPFASSPAAIRRDGTA
jgi:putative acetyltransferase